jgi:DNA repair protein RecO (recombination protein O)
LAVQQSEAILLAVTDLQEADRIVDFLTREHGRKRGAARGAKRRFSRFAGELQPLARVRVEWFETPGRELVRISAVELQRSPKRLQSDLEGLMLGAYLAESLATFAQEGEPSERYFRLLDATLEALESGVDRRLATRYLESWVLRLAGVFPAPDECPVCGATLVEGAALAASGESLLCRRCAVGETGTIPVSPGAIEFWTRIGRESPSGIASHPPTPATLAEVGAVAGRVRRHFLGHELKSLDVLRRTLGATSPA